VSDGLESEREREREREIYYRSFLPPPQPKSCRRCCCCCCCCCWCGRSPDDHGFIHVHVRVSEVVGGHDLDDLGALRDDLAPVVRIAPLVAEPRALPLDCLPGAVFFGVRIDPVPVRDDVLAERAASRDQLVLLQAEQAGEGPRVQEEGVRASLSIPPARDARNVGAEGPVLRSRSLSYSIGRTRCGSVYYGSACAYYIIHIHIHIYVMHIMVVQLTLLKVR
jgi:hypothetical protein